MATSACTSSVTAYSLSSQSCQICYEEYSEEEKKAPRVLLCGHTFCTGCLSKVKSGLNLLLEEYNEDSTTTTTDVTTPTRVRNIKCPTCQQTHPSNQPIPKNYQLLGQQSPTCLTSLTKSYLCEEHQKEKDVFCKDDNIVVCSFCVLYGDHRNHNTVPAAEECKIVKRVLEGNAEALAAFLPDVSKAQSDIQSLIDNLELGQTACKKKVEQTVEEMHRELMRRKRKALKELDEFCEDQTECLQNQLSALKGERQKCEEQLRKCRYLVKAAPAIVLDQHEEVIASSQQLCGQMIDLPLKPIMRPVIEVPRPPVVDTQLIDTVWDCIKPKFGTCEEEDVKQEEGMEEDNEEVGDVELAIEVEEFAIKEESTEQQFPSVCLD